MSQHGRSSYLDGPDYSVNPDPVPFMPSNFMSSTMVKKIPIPKRHQDTFGGYEYNFTGQRGVMLHTDRYQFEALRSFEGLNQRDRLLAEMAYLEHLRGIKRRREVVPHRAELDLFLGGKKIECEERFDINREIQRLKAMAMPTRARDLFHGRGIVLPPTHMSVLPRPPRVPVPEDSDSDEEARVSAPASTRRAPAPPAQSPTYERQISLTLGEAPHTRSYIRGRRFQQLPSLTKTQTPRADLVDSGRRSPILLAKEKRTVTSLQARLKLPRMQRDDTNLSKSQASIPQTSRSAAWVEEQNQLLSLSRTGTPDTQGSFTGSLVGTRLELQVHLPPSSRADDLHLDLEREEEDEGQKSRISPSGPPRAQAEEDTPSVQQRQSGLQSVAVTEKRLSPEAPPPSTEGRPHLPHGPRQTSPQKSHTPNPLKTGMDLDVSDEQVTNLRQTFQRLDTDMDGHLQYHQLKSQLPKEFSQQQEYFVKQVYEITSSSAVFFGVDEFMMMTQLTDRVASLTGPALEAYGKLNFDTLESAIIRYVDLFQAGDSSQRGRLSLETLRELIGRSQNKPPVDENSKVWNTIMDSLNLDYSSQVSRTEYLAHIPLFMAVAPPVLPPPEEQAGQPRLADKQ